MYYIVSYTLPNYRKYKLIVSTASDTEDLDAKVHDYITDLQGHVPDCVRMEKYNSLVHGDFFSYMHATIA